ncbi:TPA: mercury resistance system periplasmic binding protein MerP [Pseudomonas aeruginosa]|uniref:mercury resistance system periplasmic binding protein MerP n=1 Tax=Pseudomonas aeruginosa TaxID=287 RepID=UPI00068CF49B|nr:mercury resistance system periplasmic binding protein MerP [Pseudomonas aeruginosa]
MAAQQPLRPINWCSRLLKMTPGMTCSACPITVKKAISKVEGVSKVNVTFETREAVVTFDDAKTSVQKLTKATEDAGYPSSVKK